MGVQHLSWLAYGLASALFTQVCSAHVLEPIDMLEYEEGHIGARDTDYSKMDLLNYETFLWGGLSAKGRYGLGNFTTFMPGKHESIIAMEKFYPLLKSTECTKDSMTMKFEDEKAFHYGTEAWKWVNEHEKHTFLLVAGKGHCKWNEDRLPFVVKNVEFDDKTNTIKTTGEVSTWTKSAHSYELYVSGRPASTKRDWDKSFTFDIDAGIPLSHISLGSGDYKLTYDCIGCGTKGSLDFDFHIKTWLDIPHDIELILSPKGVSFTYEPTLGVSAALTEAIKPDPLSLGKIPLDGVSFGDGLLSLGPNIEFSLGASIGPLKGVASITGGGVMTVADSGSLTVDLLDPGSDSNGWETSWEQKDLTFSAGLSGSWQINLDAKLMLSLEALDHGFETGLDLQGFYGATLGLTDTTGDACPNQAGDEHTALKYTPSAGVNLIGEALYEDGTESPLLSATLWSWVHTFASWCTGVDGGITTPTASFSSQSYTVPTLTSPKPIPFSSAPSSSFPYPPYSIPTPSSWTRQPAPPSSGSGPVPPPGSTTVALPPPGSSTVKPPPPSSITSNPAPPPPPPPPPKSTTSSSVIGPRVRRRHVVPKEARMPPWLRE
ncbi:hypothetical protein N7474_007808 [Penicillium riverlandense]|uniref:uncharacterized protein n=1 Tax=Penicillium riverlandense TaxID=1903569 RepID=UPI0025489F68|nr:uncharacterized protein N7474_007808 [Penicillium riverlandense]KAJ5811507.1 hypothetical protein N7474_007808 [Penicillium riverlandense]